MYLGEGRGYATLSIDRAMSRDGRILDARATSRVANDSDVVRFAHAKFETLSAISLRDTNYRPISGNVCDPSANRDMIFQRYAALFANFTQALRNESRQSCGSSSTVNLSNDSRILTYKRVEVYDF